MKKNLCLLFSAVLFLAACKRTAQPPEPAAAGSGAGRTVTLTDEQMRSAGIRVSKAAFRELSSGIEATGEFASDTDKVVQVRAAAAGVLQEMLVAAGDEVESGQPLFRFSAAGQTPESREVKSPARGLVAGIYAETGARLDPAVPVLTISDNTRLYCGLDVREKDISRVKKGQAVEIRLLDADGETFRGTVTYISPRVDENTRTIKVRAEVENAAGKLRFGMFAAGRIMAPSGRAVLAIPEGAVRNMDGKTGVFVPGGHGVFVPRDVTVGASGGGFVEVRSGLKAGEAVVSSGGFILKSELAKGQLEEGDGD